MADPGERSLPRAGGAPRNISTQASWNLSLKQIKEPCSFAFNSPFSFLHQSELNFLFLWLAVFFVFEEFRVVAFLIYSWLFFSTVRSFVLFKSVLKG